jgi:hypothetical protein
MNWTNSGTRNPVNEEKTVLFDFPLFCAVTPAPKRINPISKNQKEMTSQAAGVRTQKNQTTASCTQTNIVWQNNCYSASTVFTNAFIFFASCL